MAGHLTDVRVTEAYLFMVPLTILAVVWATRAFQKAVS
jgi:hypothetical protein